MSKLLPLVVLPAMLLIAVGRAWTDPGAEYRGHRVLTWVIDKPAHDLRGFDDRVIGPGQRVESEPAKGYVIRFEMGAIETVTVTDFRTETKEDHVPFKISHGTRSSEGTKALTSPFPHVEYAIKEDLASVSFAVPIGSLGPGPLVELMGRKFAGTAEELEDLLLAAAVEPKYGDYVPLSDILEVYTLLGQSRRKDRWLRQLEGGSPRERLMAAVVLMNLGDEGGTEAFCDACLRARGNARVGLVEILCLMPPSDRALATMVELIVSPTTFRTQVSAGVGVSDIDRRYSLIRALTTKYPRNRIGVHENALRAWARSKAGEGHGGRQIIEFLDTR